MKITITGAAGFLGLHAAEYFRRRNHNVCELDIADNELAWRSAFANCDAVLHLAGSNRPTSEDEFITVNLGVTQRVQAICDAVDVHPKIIFSSSVHAEGSSPYGQSKRLAEQSLATWVAGTGREVVVFRLPNLFGKWGRPDYNSVVATWCSRIACGLPVTISNPTQTLRLLHVDYVLDAFARELGATSQAGVLRFAKTEDAVETTLGQLLNLLESFRDSRASGLLPNLADPFVAALHSTYTAYLPKEQFAYDLVQRVDSRGVLAEFLKSPALGQLFVSRTLPGVIRGEHFHHTKVEKFFVLEGEARIRFRDVRSGATRSYRVNGADFRVLDIPPGWTHHIENIGLGELVVLFWASEQFDSSRPDTYYEEVGPVVEPETD